MLKPLTQDFRLRPSEIMVPHPQQSTLRHHDNKNNSSSITIPQSSTSSTTIHPDVHYCPICGQAFVRSNLLAEHMHLCHQTEMLFPMDTTTVDYPCQQCDETFRSTLELENHVRNSHQMLRFSRCTACGLFGMSLSNGEYKCIHCGTISVPLGHNFYPPTIVGVPTQSSLLNSKLPSFNAKLPKPPKTNNNEQNTTSNSLQQTHQRGELNANNTNNSGGGVQVNGNCPLPIKIEIKTEPQTFYPSQSQQQHQQHQNQLPNAGTPTNKRHKCPDCDKTFKTSGTLSVHRRIHSGEAEYKCEYCQKEFIFSEYYIRHLRTHTKERPYSCSYCAKTFTQSNTLKQHTRIHTGEKPFHCIYCEKAFSVKDYLTKHIRTHTGEKPYTCTFCDKRFTQRSALTVHTTKLHPI